MSGGDDNNTVPLPTVALSTKAAEESAGATVTFDPQLETKEAADAASNEGDMEVEAEGDASTAEPHPLHAEWTLWYDHPHKRTNQRNWENFLKQVYTFKTVEEFWSVIDNVVPPSGLAQGSDYHLFRNGVAPTWEDVANKEGGKWLVIVPKKLAGTGRIDDWWMRTLLALIGEVWDDMGDDICGAVVSVRKQGDKLALWTRDSGNERLQTLIGKLWRDEVLEQRVPMGYQVHNDALKKNSSFGNKNRYTLS